jgi:hypothetical protein
LLFSTLLGTFLVGGTLHFWYGFLARRFADGSIHSVLKRLVLDQLVFSPVFIAIFMSSVLLLDGRPENVSISHPYKVLHYDIFVTDPR